MGLLQQRVHSCQKQETVRQLSKASRFSERGRSRVSWLVCCTGALDAVVAERGVKSYHECRNPW